MSKSQWQQIGMTAGWMKTAQEGASVKRRTPAAADMNKISFDSMVGTTGHSGGEAGDWKPYDDRQTENFDVGHLSQSAIDRLKIQIESKTGGHQLKLKGNERGKISILRSGQTQHVSESTVHGYRADMDYTERFTPAHDRTRNEKQQLYVIIENLKTIGPSGKPGPQVTVKVSTKESSNSHITLRGYDPNKAAELASMVVKNGPMEVEVDPLFFEPDTNEPKKPGFFGRLFGRASSYGWVKTASGWKIVPLYLRK